MDWRADSAAQNAGQPTLTIVRPSVVESCLKEPKPGWIEGVKVTDAILLAYARDKVSYFPARKAGVVDIPGRSGGQCGFAERG